MSFFLSKNHQPSVGCGAANQLTEIDALKAFRAASLGHWHDEKRRFAAEGMGSGNASKFLNSLVCVFEFLGASMETRSSAMRCWVLLHEFAPELVEHETYKAAALRFGVCPNVILDLRDTLHLSLPHLVGKRAEIVHRDEAKKKREGFRRREREKFLRREAARVARETAGETVDAA
jgi:hypothetical protein